MLTMASLFDGSGGFPLAGITAGVETLWNSEIEPFPIRVTEKRFPKVKHYGDVSRVSGYDVQPVDIITFGSPCQDLSCAGRRAGLKDGERSSLFYQAIRIIKEMREATYGQYPRFIIWENVPGAFTSNNGDDFRCVLEEVAKVKDPTAHIPGCKKWTQSGEIMGDDYSIAWRQFDSQYWGVPQRRKRIFLVADFTGRSAGDILFESEGLSGYSAKMFRTWKEVAGYIIPGTCSAGDDGLVFENHPLDSRITGPINVSQTLGVFGSNGDNLPIVMSRRFSNVFVNEDNVIPTLEAGMGMGGNNVPFVTDKVKMFYNHGQSCDFRGPVDVAQTVCATFGMGGNNTPYVTEPIAFGISPKDSNAMKSSNPNSGIYRADTARTLDLNGGNPCCNQGGIAVLEGNGSRPSHRGDGFKESDVMYTLNATEQHAVAYGVISKGNGDAFVQEEVHTSLSTGGGQAGQGYPCVMHSAGFCTEQSAQTRGIGYEDEKSPTLRAGVTPGVVAPSYGIGRTAINGGYKSGFSIPIEEERVSTLVAAGGAAVAMADTHATLSADDGPKGIHSQMMKNPEEQFVLENTMTQTTSKASFFTSGEEEVAHTLVATDYKDPPIINQGEYIVRRLTPIECARLQGFPDWWCMGLGEPNPSDEDIEKWRNIFITYDMVMGKKIKPMTDSQIRKWLQRPYTDASEYKLWGNGVSLPVVSFIMHGIVWASEKGRK